jgi:hypothetical protein
MTERVCELDLESGSTLTITKASNGTGRGIRFELLLQVAGHGEALVRLTPEELMRVGGTIAVALGYGPRPS